VSAPEIDDRVQVTTHEMAYGPHAVARLDGKVLFVRGAAPDELVEVRIRESRDRFAFADVVAVLRPSPARRPTPCPYLPRCGGCPWQHLDYAAQLAAKSAVVREQLRRIARLEAAPIDAVLPSPRQLGYRRRIKLRVDGGAVGLLAAASHSVVPIDHCLLAEPSVNAAIPAAAALVSALTSQLRRIELNAIAAQSARVVVAAEVEGPFAEADAARIETWLAEFPNVSGMALRGRGWRRSWGAIRTKLEGEDGPELTVRAPGFTQVNPLGNRALVATVVTAVDPRPGLRVLDLYAGAGNFSLPLRRRGAVVTSVEEDREAAADARSSAAGESGPSMRVIAERAERVVARLADGAEQFDAVVLDPPRAGAAGCMPALLRLRPQRIVYVSCDPATLARDLRALSPAYRVERVQPIDLFPHTYHIETVVSLRLTCEGPVPGVSSARRHAPTIPPRRRARRRQV